MKKFLSYRKFPRVSAGKDCGCAALFPPAPTAFESPYYVAKLGL